MDKKYFVTFLSPGTFFNEVSEKEIGSYDVNAAIDMARGIRERHDARPYAFYFTTKELKGTGWEQKAVTVNTSPRYFFNNKVRTLAEIEARHDPKDNILISNMKGNDWPSIVEVNGACVPFRHEDILLGVSL